MRDFLKEFSISILSLHRYAKRIIAIFTDIGLCFLCTWLAFVLRLEELIIFKNFNFYTVLVSVIIAIPIFWLFGLYRTIFHFTNFSVIFTILASTSVYGFFYFLSIGIYGIEGVPRSIGVIQPMLLFFLITLTRLGVKILLSSNYSYDKKSKKKMYLFMELEMQECN